MYPVVPIVLAGNRNGKGINEILSRPVLFAAWLPPRLLERILARVTAEGRRVLAIIRRCLEEDRYAVSVHFTERMQQRGLYWPDVEAVIHAPTEVRSQGMDRFHRPKWIIRGEAVDVGEIEVVCAAEVDETETEFITLYWED